MKEGRTFEYTSLERVARKVYRKFRPVPCSPWTEGHVDDISEVHLVPPEKLISFFGKCIEDLRRFKGDNIGDYLEFGVFNGSSIGSMYRAREAVGAEMRLFGFDAFEGLPPESENEDAGVWKKGFYKCSFEEMQTSLQKRGISADEMTWIKGWYSETLNPETTAEHSISNPGIVFIDCDTYSSSKTVLDYIAPMLTKPAIICLDDWKLNDLDVKGGGEYRSFNEFLAQNPHLQATPIYSYNRKSRTFLIRPR